MEATNVRRWAAHPLNADSDQLFAKLENSFPVRLIATKSKLVTCPAKRPVAEIIDDPALSDFDHIPVVENDVIIGLVNRTKLNADALVSGSKPQTARDIMHPLDETILISADDGILSFIESADVSPCRLVLERKKISSIVTLSDLQRLPVRPLLFFLITHVELLVLDELRRSEKKDEALLQTLSKRRQKKASDNWSALQQHNLCVDRLTATELCDKREMLWKVKEWDMTRGKFSHAFEEIEWLRNAVAHAGDYALSRENAKRTIVTVRICRDWIDRLEELRTPKGPQQ